MATHFASSKAFRLHPYCEQDFAPHQNDAGVLPMMALAVGKFSAGCLMLQWVLASGDMFKSSNGQYGWWTHLARAKSLTHCKTYLGVSWEPPAGQDNGGISTNFWPCWSLWPFLLVDFVGHTPETCWWSSHHFVPALGISIGPVSFHCFWGVKQVQFDDFTCWKWRFSGETSLKWPELGLRSIYLFIYLSKIIIIILNIYIIYNIVY